MRTLPGAVQPLYCTSLLSYLCQAWCVYLERCSLLYYLAVSHLRLLLVLILICILVRVVLSHRFSPAPFTYTHTYLYTYKSNTSATCAILSAQVRSMGQAALFRQLRRAGGSARFYPNWDRPVHEDHGVWRSDERGARDAAQ